MSLRLIVYLSAFLISSFNFCNADQQKYYTLSSGHKMPAVGLGTGSLKSDEVENVITLALENGYRHIDTAFIYYNEKGIGKALKKWFDKGGRREDLFVTSKLPFFGNEPSAVEKYLKMSLSDLGLDYVDMYLIHAPIPFEADSTGLQAKEIDGNPILKPTIDLKGIWKEMENQVKAGRAKSIGLSNFNKTQILTVYDSAKIKPSNLQVEAHAYMNQKVLKDFCELRNIVVTAYAPLGSRRVKENRPALVEHPLVKEISKKYNRTTGQILLRFGVQNGFVVIPKTANLERLKTNFRIFDFELSNEDMKKLDSLNLGEAGRVYTFSGNKMENHPYYPFYAAES